MPKGTKVAKAEGALKRAYPGGGKKADEIVYGRLNNIGFMRGNQPTRKGLAKARGKSGR